MPLMQRHVDIYRHKVIMGIHNRARRDKYGETTEIDRADANSNENFSAAAELEMN
jgi:hypothetical protein